MVLTAGAWRHAGHTPSGFVTLYTQTVHRCCDSASLRPERGSLPRSKAEVRHSPGIRDTAATLLRGSAGAQQSLQHHRRRAAPACGYQLTCLLPASSRMVLMEAHVSRPGRRCRDEIWVSRRRREPGIKAHLRCFHLFIPLYFVCSAWRHTSIRLTCGSAHVQHQTFSPSRLARP